jgi:hypothetical protein
MKHWKQLCQINFVQSIFNSDDFIIKNNKKFIPICATTKKCFKKAFFSKNMFFFYIATKKQQKIKLLRKNAKQGRSLLSETIRGSRREQNL